MESPDQVRAAISALAASAAQDVRVRAQGSGTDGDYYLIETDASRGMDLMDELTNTGRFVCVFPSVASRHHFDPNDPVSEENDDWHLDQILATDAWGITTGSSSVRIGVIDEGVDETHVTNSTTGDILNYDTACAPA